MQNKIHAPEHIQTEEALRRIIPSYPKMLDKRIQRTLDHFSLEFINVAKIAFLATNSQEESMLPLHVNIEIKALDSSQFIINQNQSSNSEKSANSQHSKHKFLNASLYFMAPGLGHGLRINGTLNFNKTKRIFNIEEVYFHCARAAARAEIWNSKTSTKIEHNNIIQHSPFLLLKTMNLKRKTELSPRGDEAGFVKIISKETLLLPERPGNKIAISLRNIIACPDIELLFLCPNTNKLLNIKGTAKVVSSQELLNQCTINGKTPKTGILIHIESACFTNNIAIEESGIWNSQNGLFKSSITPFSKALSAHINGRGLLGKATNVIVGAVVKHDMRNLY